MTTCAPVSKHEEILKRSIPLFARAGFHAVSMRDIAAEVGMRAAALYHHFPNKQGLYLAAMRHAFADKTVVLTEALAVQGSALARLDRFVDTLATVMASDPDLLALLQRERLDGDDARLKLLAEEVFAKPFEALMVLASELAPQRDAHMVSISICALVMYHIETASLRRFFPGWSATHDRPKFLSQHARGLLAQLFSDGDQA